MSSARTVPLRALVLSLASLVVPLVGSTWLADTASDADMLPWVCVLIPGFLLSYHKGWRGSALALAGGMAVIPLWAAFLSLRGVEPPGWERVTLMVSAYLAFCIGIGWVTELLHRDRERAEDRVLVDPITGLPNRKHAEVFLAAAATSSRAARSPLAVALFDVDRFSWLIDTHGQIAGDQVMHSAARLLRGRAREEWFCARAGSDQLLVVMPHTTASRALQFAEEVGREFERLDLRWRPLTLSAGVASDAGSRAGVESLLASAEEALVRAKKLGPARVERAGGSRPEASEASSAPAPPVGAPLAGSPRGILALPPELRPSVRAVLELNGLHVEEFDGVTQLPFELGAGGPLAVVVTGASHTEALAETLAVLEARVGAAAPRAVFFTGGDPADPLPQPPGTIVLRGEPSGERLLPILGSLLTGALGARVAPESRVGGGFASPLMVEGAPLTAGRIMVVEDERPTRAAIQRTLEGIGFRELVVCSSGQEALVAVVDTPPDLMVLDLNMPGMDGFAVLEALRPLLEGDGFLPVLVVTGEQSWEHRQRALRMGAKDFMHKPFDVAELGARVLNLMETRKLHLQLRDTNSLLEVRVQQRTRELALAKDEILFRLARAAEYRDDMTGRHAARVGAAAAVLAEGMGLAAAECEIVRMAAPLHDVGKIGIPDAILLKRGGLTSEEMEVMKRHTTIGADLLAHSTSQVIETGSIIALTHHERWDGRGYPRGLRGEEIPIQGRLVALADALDALTHVRPYKGAVQFEDAIVRLIDEAGSAFDPAVAAALKVTAFRVRDIVLDRAAHDADVDVDILRSDLGPLADWA